MNRTLMTIILVILNSGYHVPGLVTGFNASTAYNKVVTSIIVFYRKANRHRKVNDFVQSHTAASSMNNMLF